MTNSERPPSHPGSLPDSLDAERRDLLELLQKHRFLFRGSIDGVSDEQAAATPTVSELSLGGLLKHVTATEREWARFLVEGPAEAEEIDWANVDWSNPPAAVVAREQEFRMLEGETLAGLLAAYDDVAAATDTLAATADLDRRWPLPPAPWFEPGATWSVRRVLHHIAVETAQHAGHADIIRETIDGRKSMG